MRGEREKEGRAWVEIHVPYYVAIIALLLLLIINSHLFLCLAYYTLNFICKYTVRERVSFIHEVWYYL